MAYTNHILTCGFVIVGKWSIANDQDTWLSYEIEPGPYISEDTTGLNGEEKVRGICKFLRHDFLRLLEWSFNSFIMSFRCGVFLLLPDDYDECWIR